MKFTTLEYEDNEYELVSIPVDYETTDWWLVDSDGQLVKAGFYECAEEVVDYFDFWNLRDYLPRNEHYEEESFYTMIDFYYNFGQDEAL